MNIHVLCPMYKMHLVPTLIHYFEPMGIQWYPILTPSETIRFKSKEIQKIISTKTWIHPVYVNELPPKATCCQKFNDFLTQHKILDNDYYTFMCDDNMYEPGFFDVIRQQSAKILICSLYRGDTIPNDNGQPHPTFILRHHKISSIRPGLIDYAQYIIKGEIFKHHPFDPYINMTDGVYIQTLCHKYPNNVTFLPDLYAWFNYFQPGRYTTKNPFPKSHWELPKII